MLAVCANELQLLVVPLRVIALRCHGGHGNDDMETDELVGMGRKSVAWLQWSSPKIEASAAPEWDAVAQRRASRTAGAAIRRDIEPKLEGVRLCGNGQPQWLIQGHVR